ncbi:hypothetical protein PENFLA_c008G02282 [Penicillium flavigenum]|uniref:MYND-type domain-containing protein n=1 Tax=Penicillium flavigenum TaxID=254877 RepID=A0A1V6TIE4_9EURO|nr:hypothetical protein PENFLA_c008G02282 [Penicillium flavigenum]
MTARTCIAPDSKAWYCSRDCQKADYKVHKLRSAPTIPYNCSLIRATPASDGQSDAAYIEPFHLKSYGNWGLEMKELKERLGWPQADEAGKFYPQKDIDTWYYYMYQSSAQNLPSPEDVDDYEESFTRMDLEKTTDYYKTANSR